MAKKTIRITESQLHNIIAESVERILTEWTPDSLKNAQTQHPKLFNKVSHAAFGKRAHGVDGLGRQRDTDYDTREAMGQYAANAWNKKYGKDYSENYPVSPDHMAVRTDKDSLNFSLNNNQGFRRTKVQGHVTYPKNDNMSGEEWDRNTNIITPYTQTTTDYSGDQMRDYVVQGSPEPRRPAKDYTQIYNRNRGNEAENEIFKMQNGEHEFIPGYGWR